MFDKNFFIMFLPQFIEIFTEISLIGIFLKSSLKNNILKIFISSLLLILICTFFKNYFPRYYMAFAFLLPFLIISYIIYRSTISKTLFYTILTFLIILILDFMVSMLFMLLDNHLYSRTIFIDFLGKTVFTFLLVLITFYIYYKNFHLTLESDLSKFSSFPLLSNILVTFFLILPNILIIGIYFQNQILPFSIIFINITAIILSFFLSIYNTSKSSSLIHTKHELQFQRNYTSTLENLVDSLKTFKHDFDNTLQLLYGYIEIESMEGLKKTFHQVLDESKTISSLAKINPDKIKNPHLYGLLSVKNNIAIENNICLDINIDTDIDNIDIQIFDFSRILGIFLDNAIDATQDAKYKKICFSISQTNDNIQVLIQNTYSQLALSTTEMFEKGKSSKGTDRGLGLYEVKKLLNKYKNCNLYTYTEDCYFCQKLIVPLSKVSV